MKKADRNSRWTTVAKRRWPKSNVFLGSGPFAVLTCAFYHDTGRQMVYSEVHLCETREQAEQLSESLYCHARTRGWCRGKHAVIKLDAIFSGGSR